MTRHIGRKIMKLLNENAKLMSLEESVNYERLKKRDRAWKFTD